MKNWDSQLNTVRVLAVLVLCAIVFAIVQPASRQMSLWAAAVLCGGLIAQLFFHSRSIEIKERPSDAEQVRLNLR